MQVSLEILEEDYHAFQRHVLSKQVGTRTGRKYQPRWRLTLLWVFLVGFFFIIERSFNPFWIDAAVVLPACVISIVVLLGYSWIVHRGMWRNRPNKDGSILGKRIVQFDESGVQVQADLLRAWYDWKLVEGIAETDKHLFIYVDKPAAVIIPKRAFSSLDEMATWVKYGIERASK